MCVEGAGLGESGKFGEVTGSRSSRIMKVCRGSAPEDWAGETVL